MVLRSFISVTFFRTVLTAWLCALPARRLRLYFLRAFWTRSARSLCGGGYDKKCQKGTQKGYLKKEKKR